MEWSDLRIFLAAVRAGSYTVAGQNLGINRTTVGRRIEALEKALGLPLFDYHPLGPSPTAAGHRVLEAAAAFEREAMAMRTDLGLADAPAGTIRIAGSAGIAVEFLPELLAFRRDNPAFAFELLGELDPIDAVTHRRAELGLALVRLPPLHLTGVQVATLSQAPYAARDAGDLPLLGWGHEIEAALPGGPWTAANPAGDAANRQGLATFNSWPQMKQAVAQGCGRAVLWCFAADADPRLQRLAPPDPRHDCPVWLVHRGKAPPSPALARLIAFLGAAIAARVT